MSHLLYVHSLSTTVEMEVANPGLRHLIVTIATTHLLEAWSGNQYSVIAVSPKWTASKWKGLAVRGWNFEDRWRKLRVGLRRNAWATCDILKMKEGTAHSQIRGHEQRLRNEIGKTLFDSIFLNIFHDEYFHTYYLRRILCWLVFCQL